MSRLSVGRKTTTYVVSAVLLSALIIAASTLYLGLPTLLQSTNLESTSSSASSSAFTSGSSTSSSAFSFAGPQALLVIQLTDPPQVPHGTKSLNLTYTALGLLVGEQSGGKVNPTSVNVTPIGGSATLNLLKLQNVSQTIASGNLPNGSIIYSVTFTVSSIAINVNGTVSQVTLATGGNSFSVTIAQPLPLQGENVVLLQLNPIIVGTPTGYQLIPSAVGVVRPSQGQGEERVGWQHQLTNEDDHDLDRAHGNLTANLLALSVSGSTTTVTVQVRNSGGAAVTLNAIGLHGNFTMSGNACSTSSSTTTSSTRTSTTTTHGSSTRTETRPGSETSHRFCQLPEHMNEVVFVPVGQATSSTSTSSKTTTSASTTSSASCTSAQMKLVNAGPGGGGNGRGLVLQAGQCVSLTFAGTITFGESANALVPSTASGQRYDLHVIASGGANLQLSCVLPLGATSCKVDTWSNSQHDH